MKRTLHHNAAVGSLVAAAALIAGTAMPAFALNVGLGASLQASASGSASGTRIGAGANLGASISAKTVANIANRADLEITRRLDVLASLETRVNAMVRLSDSQKSNLSAALQAQISAMKALQAQIAADAQANSTSSLKADVLSITKSYRIFALVMPQAAITAASDRVLEVANVMADLGTKLSARISADQAASASGTAAANAALSDFNAKVADAQVQANAAASAVASLTPDNGDQNAMAANTAALQAARAKVVAAQHDLIAARADAMTIIKALSGIKVSADASTTVSSTAGH